MTRLQRGSGQELACLDDLLAEFVAATQQAVDLARVRVLENQHRNQHQQGIEHVDECFVLHQVSIVSLQVFHHTDHRTDQNKDAGDVEGGHMTMPDTIQLDRSGRRRLCEANLEDDGRDGEKAEENDLHEKTADDNILAHRGTAVARHHESGAFELLVPWFSVLCVWKGGLPEACIRKDKTSPATKIFVNHLNLITEHRSASTIKMIRPSVI